MPTRSGLLARKPAATISGGMTGAKSSTPVGCAQQQLQAVPVDWREMHHTSGASRSCNTGQRQRQQSRQQRGKHNSGGGSGMSRTAPVHPGGHAHRPLTRRGG